MWNSDLIQFPRLLAEINAVGLNKSQVKQLCESMDLKEKEIKQVFDRAEREWDKIKKEVIDPDNLPKL